MRKRADAVRFVLAAAAALFHLGSVHPQNATVQNLSPARTLVEAAHWKRARALVEPRVKSNPRDAEAAYLLSRIRMAYGDFDGSLKEAERAVALDDRNADYHFQLARAAGEVAKRGSFFTKMRAGPRFKKEVEAALALNPKHLAARIGLIMFYLQAPGIMGGDKKKADAIADQMLQVNPEEGYFAKAVLAEEENKPAEMEAAYQKVIERNPNNYSALMGLANYYRWSDRKRYDLAEKYARDAARLEPDRTAPLNILAAVLAIKQDWGELEDLLAQSEKNIPDNLNPWLQAANAMYPDGKDLPRAERYLRKYLTQEPEPNAAHPAAAHYLLGLVLEKAGRKAEAISELEVSLRLKPDYEPPKKALRRLKG